MKEIVKVLLQEGIDEYTIHEVLDILENREEQRKEAAKKVLPQRQKKYDDLHNEGEDIYYKDLDTYGDETFTPNFDKHYTKKEGPAMDRLLHAEKIAKGDKK